MTILEAALSDGSGILENGVGMTGVQSHGMDPTQAKALVQGMDEHSKDALKVKAVQEEQALHQQKARDASQLFKLGDRTIIVTGATGGMGLSIVEALLQSGADVIGIDVGEAPTHPSWSELLSLAKSTGTVLTYHGCNISCLETTYACFEGAIRGSRYPLRGLVNCAGIGWIGSSIDFPADEARKIIDVNLMGTMICAQAAARLVQEHDLSASFVFIASMSGYVVNKGTPNAAYAASKAGVQQLTRNFASEWGYSKAGNGPSIRVNSVSPGVIRTPMTSGILKRQDLDDMWTEETMLKRLAEPEDFRGPIIFLLSDASGYVTGADLLVDGGYTAW